MVKDNDNIEYLDKTRRLRQVKKHGLPSSSGISLTELALPENNKFFEEINTQFRYSSVDIREFGELRLNEKVKDPDKKIGKVVEFREP